MARSKSTSKTEVGDESINSSRKSDPALIAAASTALIMGGLFDNISESSYVNGIPIAHLPIRHFVPVESDDSVECAPVD